MRALPLAVILVLAPVALAQEHAHDNENGAAVVLFDGPASGRAVVGAYTHFGFALLDKDAAPVVHQNAQFVVTQNGKVLFSTTDTHEYDGLFSFDLRFTQTGPYEVLAMSGDMALGSFRGEAIEPVNATAATIALVATPQGTASRLVDFEISILDASGAIIPHADAIVELRAARDGFLLSRTHLHIHEDPILFTQALGPDTDYVAEVVAYLAFATGRSDDVPAVYAEFPVSVGPVAPPSIPAPELGAPAPLGQAGGTASADGKTLHLMYDPNQQVGVLQTARIAGIVVEDADHTFVPHVDFALTLAGPRGLVFSSENGHEYDGTFEYLFRPDAPGLYDGVMTATYDETVLSVPVHLQVVPGVVPVLGGTGLVSATIDGLDGIEAGKETNLTFDAASAAGAAKHSEVDVTIFRDGEPPLYQFKLHTHESGLTNAVLVFPEEGSWNARIDPLPTVPEASVYAPTLITFEVAPGAPDLGNDAIVPTSAPTLDVPGSWSGLTFLALALALALAFALRR